MEGKKCIKLIKLNIFKLDKSLFEIQKKDTEAAEFKKRIELIRQRKLVKNAGTFEWNNGLSKRMTGKKWREKEKMFNDNSYNGNHGRKTINKAE